MIPLNGKFRVLNTAPVDAGLAIPSNCTHMIFGMDGGSNNKAHASVRITGSAADYPTGSKEIIVPLGIPIALRGTQFAITPVSSQLAQFVTFLEFIPS